MKFCLFFALIAFVISAGHRADCAHFLNSCEELQSYYRNTGHTVTDCTQFQGPNVADVASLYFTIEERVSWDDASKLCKMSLGNLVSIHSFSEQRLVAAFAVSNYDSPDVWIGLHRENWVCNENWIWSDGSPVHYYKWGNSQPDCGQGGVEVYAEARWYNNPGYNFQWNDLGPKDLLRPLCKMQLN